MAYVNSDRKISPQESARLATLKLEHEDDQLVLPMGKLAYAISAQEHQNKYFSSKRYEYGPDWDQIE